MKMPKDGIEPALFAPCGMNCAVCYRHCDHKKPCGGCRAGNEGKTEHCRSCKIRECVGERRLVHCYECGDYPCQLIRNLEKSYNKRYSASLIENSLFVRDYGLAAFMRQQTGKYTCPACGGIISIHSRECSECRLKPDNRL